MNFPAVRGRTRRLTVPGITRTRISPQTTLRVSPSHLFPDADTDRGPSVRGRSASDESTATEPESPGVASVKASDRPGGQAGRRLRGLTAHDRGILFRSICEGNNRADAKSSDGAPSVFP